MNHGPKEKKERALGEHLQLKGTRCRGPKCALVRKPYKPGAHGQGGRRPKNLSEFGRQIREKQKFKLTYGMHESNLRHLFERAAKTPGSTAKRLIELLERRLDNVIYRLGFVPSHGAARQVVTHGHITVNGKRVRSPGFMVRQHDMIGVRPESISKAAFKDLKESLKKYDAPSWLALDPDKVEGRILSAPEGVEVPFEINLLVESFNK